MATLDKNWNSETHWWFTATASVALRLCSSFPVGFHKRHDMTCTWSSCRRSRRRRLRRHRPPRWARRDSCRWRSRDKAKSVATTAPPPGKAAAGGTEKVLRGATEALGGALWISRLFRGYDWKDERTFWFTLVLLRIRIRDSPIQVNWQIQFGLKKDMNQ